MAQIEKSIEIKAPIEKIYAVCSDIEGYTRFMEGAKDITMTGEKSAHWKMEMVGRTMEFDTEMIENVENEKVAWKSIGDFVATGSWKFEPTDQGVKVISMMNYEIPGILGKIFDKIKISKETEKNMESSLLKLKQLIEAE